MNIWAVFEYTVAVSIVGLLICGIKQIFRDKLDARWHYFIWLVLLVRLLVPVDVKWIATPLSVFYEIPIGKWFEMAQIIAEKNSWTAVFERVWLVYLAGVGILGLYYGISWIALGVRIRLAQRAESGTVAYVEEIARKYQLKSCKDIRILKSNTPFVFGVFAPVLVLPEENQRPVETIIVHELLHRKNKDVLVNLGLHVLRVINWFNPLAWIFAATVQNDSEALCDQRVLELCGREEAGAYGEMLVAMSCGKGGNLAKIGTSNMASTYRNMHTRIERIKDFRRVPAGLGFVTGCITLMLTVAAVGTSASEQKYFKAPEVHSERDLERGLLEARCYHASTPHQAVYLFLRAVKERNLFYRMAVTPKEAVEQMEYFAKSCLAVDNEEDYGDVECWDSELYGMLYPKEMFFVESFLIYNMQYDESRGSAVVWAKLEGQESEADFVRWELALHKENGWKVVLNAQGERETQEYTPDALLYGSAQLGDFFVEIAGYNEGYFSQLQEKNQHFMVFGNDAENEAEVFPEFFTWEYTSKNVYLTYTGEADLSGHTVRVECAENGAQLEKLGRAGALMETAYRIENEAVLEAESTGDNSGLEEAKRKVDELQRIAGKLTDGEALTEEEKAVESRMTSTSYSSSAGNSVRVFSGEELSDGGRKLLNGGGSGYNEPGYGFKADDSIGTYVRIYIDEELVQEGEVWSGIR